MSVSRLNKVELMIHLYLVVRSNFLIVLTLAFLAGQAFTRPSIGQDATGFLIESPLPATYVNGKLLDFIPNQTHMGLAPPTGAVVLLSSETNRFLQNDGGPANWPNENGVITSSKNGENELSNHIVSELHFRDAEIHVEFKMPAKGEGNSGIYIHGNYELQIFNSFKKGKTQELSHHDIGAVYGFAKPLSNASKPPGQWQVYDIRYRAPRRSADGSIITLGEITAWLNGVLVQHATTFGEPRSVYHPYRYHTTEYLKTIWERQKKTSVGPVFLQDHHTPVQFRNIWIKPLDDEAKPYDPATLPADSDAATKSHFRSDELLDHRLFCISN